MDKEYIEREAAKRAIMSQYLSRANKTKYADVIDAVPAADVVPVVRCKECKFRVYGGCSLHGIWRGENFYCADGERKDGDGE